ncbi:MAG: 2-oxoacid:ferredoxin oxidoreductase subunit beta [Candidatus Thermoplasmatota archaeon]|nr:2-oxoacid:ferredoxin oxidoreductase subunit beta [Candidatus Thermoplasmatota archaeon]MCL5665407.1 2-oxoacid:ferredoxin oxidoreductase subunit beta [Candidatus Thermoplasmatota archaeon]
MAHNFRTDLAIDWCPGCGDFGILTALTQALSESGTDPRNVVLASGIGCSGKTPHYVNVAGIHTLHGRAIPFAVGIKLANPNLKVLVTSGDGDMLGIGAGHFVAEGRRNVGLTVMIYDNQVYGLTKGQASPTMTLGMQTKSLSKPNIFGSINPITLALSAGYTFVARGFSFDTKQLKDIIKRAMVHEGSSVIDILQPCPTYNNVNTMEVFRKKVYKLEDDKDWDPVITNSNEEQLMEKYQQAYKKGMEWDDRIPTGIFFENRTVPSFPKRISEHSKSYLENPPALQVVSDEHGKSIVDPMKTFADRIV